MTAASNQREHAYGVEMQSPFAVKGIYGNIVLYMAINNSMDGGLCVLEGSKITANNGDVSNSNNSRNKNSFTGFRPCLLYRLVRGWPHLYKKE